MLEKVIENAEKLFCRSQEISDLHQGRDFFGNRAN